MQISSCIIKIYGMVGIRSSCDQILRSTYIIMEWIDKGYVLTTRYHGENSLIVSLLTEKNGKSSGLVHGGGSSKRRGIYQPGNFLDIIWKARLPDHLGTYRCELIRSHAANFLDAPLPLLALSSAVIILERALPEREPDRELFKKFGLLLKVLREVDWAPSYVRWELDLLTNLGFGLDLSKCAVTGCAEELTHVSPKTGKAVSEEIARPYADKLLVLPRFLLKSGFDEDLRDLINGFALTGYFLQRHVFGGKPDALPIQRERMIAALT